MEYARSFEDLEIWQKGIELTRLIYRVTAKGGFAADFGLKNQIRRASISIVSNIAEGHESQSKRLFVRYLRIAKGSAGEVRAQLYIAFDQQYITNSEFQSIKTLCKDTSRKIFHLIQHLTRV